MKRRVHLSGFFFEQNGWKKSGFVWTKGFSTVTYDGCDWMYCPGIEGIKLQEDGSVKVVWKKIEFVDEIKIKK